MNKWLKFSPAPATLYIQGQATYHILYMGELNVSTGLLAKLLKILCKNKDFAIKVNLFTKIFRK